jgi:O-antigen ligase
VPSIIPDSLPNESKGVERAGNAQQPGSEVMTDLVRRAVWPLAAIVGGVLVGVGVALSPNVAVIIGVILASVVGLALAISRRRRDIAFINVVVLVLIAMELSANFGARVVVLVVILLHVVVLAIVAPRTKLILSDAGAVLLSAAIMLPAVIAGDAIAIAGNAAATLGVYTAVRLAQPGQRLLVWTLLGVGAIQAVAAVMQAIGLTAGPWSPLFAAIPYHGTRSTGLLDNPNQLGLLEAGIIVLACWHGLTWRTIPFVLLCGVALLLSGSREAVLGMALGLLPILIRRPAAAVVAAVSIVGVFVWYTSAFPEAVERFDPSRFSTDPSLLARINSWEQALRLIARSPYLGYGSGVPLVTDQAYLGWLLAGGVVTLVAGLAGLLILLLTTRPWPVFLVPIAAGFLAASFSGTPLSLLLITAAALPRLARRPGVAGLLPPLQAGRRDGSGRAADPVADPRAPKPLPREL